MNSFHLASWFHPESLKVLLEFVGRDQEALVNLVAMAKSDLGQTPLHVAAKKEGTLEYCNKKLTQARAIHKP